MIENLTGVPLTSSMLRGKTMKTPTWVTVVGVLGIVFGVFGLLSAAQTAMMPDTIELQQKFMESVPMSAPGQQAAAEQLKKLMQGLWGSPPTWFRPACVILGVLTLVVSAVYVFAAVSFLQMKHFSIKLMYVALAMSIALSVVRGAVFAKALSTMGMIMLFGGVVGIVIDVILMVVVATGDKTAFLSRELSAGRPTV